MSSILCSIIIPTYNHGSFIDRSVSSALAQTYSNTEVIVVDDGSTDDTGDRLKEYGDKIIYLRKENEGLGAARNTGIRLSRGRYLQFLDADDTIEKDKLKTQVEILERNTALALVYSDCRSTDFEGKETENISYLLREDEDPLPVLMGRVLTSLNACLTRKSAVIGIGMFDECRHAQEDWDFWIRLCLRGYKVKYSPGDFVHYDQTGSEMTKNPELMYWRTRHMLEKYLSDPEFGRLDKSLIDKFVAHQNFQLATRAYNNRWWYAARRHFLLAAIANRSVVNSKYWTCIPKTYLFQFIDQVTGREVSAPKQRSFI
jgi:glycosyltransferase involved in cell wall biosynthesis